MVTKRRAERPPTGTVSLKPNRSCLHLEPSQNGYGITTSFAMRLFTEPPALETVTEYSPASFSLADVMFNVLLLPVRAIVPLCQVYVGGGVAEATIEKVALEPIRTVRSLGCWVITGGRYALISRPTASLPWRRYCPRVAFR